MTSEMRTSDMTPIETILLMTLEVFLVSSCENSGSIINQAIFILLIVFFIIAVIVIPTIIYKRCQRKVVSAEVSSSTSSDIQMSEKAMSTYSSSPASSILNAREHNSCTSSFHLFTDYKFITLIPANKTSN